MGLTPRLSGGGAQKGIRLAANGTADIGATCRQRLSDVGGNIHEEEKDVDLIAVGWDALVAITHKNNPVKNISTDNLRAIFEGKLTNWKDLGGPDLKIQVLTRKGSTSGVGYMARIMIFNDPGYEYKEKGKIFKSTGPIEKNAAKIEGSIAFDGVSSARKADVATIGIDGFLPTKENIASGNYPLFRPLYVAVNKTNKNPHVSGFIEFLTGPEGQEIISQQGTVNLAEGKTLPGQWQKKAVEMGNLWQESDPFRYN